MISKKAERFLVELRLYLISKGKNDKEMNEIIEEIEDHIIEAESEGKDITHIVGKSPKEYMKSIGQSMETDYSQIAALIPVMILLLVAYASLVPAIEGNFRLDSGIILIALIGGIFGLAIYSLFLFKMLPKLFHSKWVLFIGVFISLFVTGLLVLIIFWYRSNSFEPIFIASPFQNKLIVFLCITIFIGSAIYTKSWISIVIPLFISLGPVTSLLIPEDINEDPFYIIITCLILLVISIVFFYFLIKKGPKRK